MKRIALYVRVSKANEQNPENQLIRSSVIDYMDFRKKRLAQLGLKQSKVEPLFPNERGQYYTEGGWIAMRSRQFRKAGVEGTYKVLRPSFGQKLKDKGASIEAVSKALHHTSVVTTEQFYARIRTKDAWDNIEETWERPDVKISIPAD